MMKKGREYLKSVQYINRITVEFKCPRLFPRNFAFLILIESQWNLNDKLSELGSAISEILIESQWNLNSGQLLYLHFLPLILIELQWNLNESITSLCYSCQRNINRITVEFKDRSKVLLG